MNKPIMALFFLSLSLPCASYAGLSDLVRKMPSMFVAKRLMTRSIVTLTHEQQGLYKKKLEHLSDRMENIKNTLKALPIDSCNQQKDVLRQSLEDVRSDFWHIKWCLRQQEPKKFNPMATALDRYS